MSFIERLAPLRAQPGTRLTTGLDDATLERLAAGHPALVAAIDAAATEFERVRADLGDLLALDERAQIDAMQDGFVLCGRCGHPVRRPGRPWRMGGHAEGCGAV